MTKQRLIAILLGVLISTLFAFDGFAEGVENEKVYKPMDLVVVVDSSGSMKFSDQNRTSLAAVRMLANMMPAEDSRIGIVSFNRKPTTLTASVKGTGGLVPLKDFTGVESVRSVISSVQFSGGTAIGNALYAATELLNGESNTNHAKAIMIFTDGINDLDKNPLAESECEGNEVSAIKWAKENDCRIYCIGYDYVQNGVRSMGPNGEGLAKLENISTSTKGRFEATSDISKIENLLIEFLADAFDIIIDKGGVIPGDGGYHEMKISVSPSVVEANLRLAGASKNAIANGDIHLYDPSGREVELRNSGNVRFDTDATAASIKVIMPESGDWLLTVKGIKGDDVNIWLLQHYKMNLTSQLLFPDGNPEGVAYTNDIIGIKTYLSYNGQQLTDKALYDTVTSAQAVCVSHANPDDKKVITLTRDDLSFVGSFTIPEDSFYDITIRLEWKSLYREDTLTVASTNGPVVLVKEIGDVKVNKGKTIQINDLYTYVKDPENDPVEAYVKEVYKSDVCDLSINGDSLSITGLKGWWAKTLVTVAYKDAHGSEVQTTFKVSVGDPGVLALLLSLAALIAVAAAFIAYTAVDRILHIKGSLYLVSISCDKGEDEYALPLEKTFCSDPDAPDLDENAIAIQMRRFYRTKQKRNIKGVIDYYFDLLFQNGEVPADLAEIRDFLTGATGRALMTGTQKSRIRGSADGGTFTVRVSKKTPFLRINRSQRVDIGNGASMEIEFSAKGKDRNKQAGKILIKTKFESPVRVTRKKAK